MPPRKKKKRRSTGLSGDLVTKNFSESEVDRWKTMDKKTEEYLLSVLDEGISTIKTNSRKDRYVEINDHLNKCRHNLVKKWKKMKTPTNTFGAYKGLQKLNMSYNSTLSDMTKIEEDVESAVHKAEKTCKAMEKQLEKRERCLEKDTVDMHHLLRADIQTSLHIPHIPRFVAES